MSDSDSSIISARPRVKFDGQEPAVVAHNLIAMRIDEQMGGLTSLELRLLNIRSDEGGGADLAFEDDDIIKLGAEVVIGMGDEQNSVAMFRGLVTAIEELYGSEGPPEILVLAEDKLRKAQLARRTKVWEDATISDIANQVANDLGLTPRVTGLSANIGTQVQLNESDLAFLRRLLATHDGEMQVIEGELHVAGVADVSRGELDFDGLRDLRRARFSADLAEQVSQITISGWDAAQGERIGVTSNVSSYGPGSGSTGAQKLQQAFGRRSEHVSFGTPLNSDEAQALADAAHRQRAGRFVKLDGTAEGNPRLRVGTRVRVSGGVSRRFVNTYRVVRTCHRFDLRSGYETDFEAECAYLGGS